MTRAIDRKFLKYITLTILIGFANMGNAQVSDDDWKKRQASAELQKKALDEEAAVAESEVKKLNALKKLAEAQATPDAAKAATADAIASAKAGKELADAKKAQSEADLAAFKAKIGEVPASGIQGSITLSDKAGSMETALLAAGATTTASREIGRQIKETIGSASTIFVFANGEAPNLKELNDFRAMRELVFPEYTGALRNLDSALSRGAELPIFGGIGVSLDAITKLLGFFKSDFTIGGTDLTPDQNLLAETIASAIKKSNPDVTVNVQAIFYKYTPAATAKFLQKEFSPLDGQHQIAVDKIRMAELKLEDLNKDFAKMPGDTVDDQEKKRKFKESLNSIQVAIDRVKKVNGIFEAAKEKITKEDKLNAMARQFETEEKFNSDNTYVLIAKLHKVGGSHYVAKNLWTSFGAMPFKVMGGVIVSYSLFKAKTGEYIQGNLIPIHGGFVNANKVGAAINEN